MNEGIFVPLALFAALAIIAVAAFHFNYKKRLVVYDAIKTAIDKTGSIDPALVEAIIRDNVGPYADLRKGIILIAIAAAFMTLGYCIPDDEALGPMIGVASFPGLVGISYVLFHFFAPREATV